MFDDCLYSLLVWVLIIGMGLFVVGVDWLFGVSPDDKSDDSSRVLASIVAGSSTGFVLVSSKVDLLGDVSPDDKPDGSSRVLVSLVAESFIVVALMVLNADFFFFLIVSLVLVSSKVDLFVLNGLEV